MKKEKMNGYTMTVAKGRVIIEAEKWELPALQVIQEEDLQIVLVTPRETEPQTTLEFREHLQMMDEALAAAEHFEFLLNK